MKTRKLNGFRVLGLAAVLALVLSACTINLGNSGESSNSPEAASNELLQEASGASEKQNYLNQLQGLSQRETDILSKYDSVSGENYTDDETLYYTLMELIPDVQQFIGDLEAITPTDPLLAEIQKTLVDGWNLQSKGFTLAAAALADQDLSKIAEANEALAQGRALLRTGSQKVSSLN